MFKYASFEVLSAVQVGGRGLRAQEVGFRRAAHRHAFEYDPKPGFLYVRSRAISSRCNDNFDEFPAAEIKTAYRTFLGKPVFVNHVNENHRRARGVIIDAALHEDTNPDGSPDTWCEVLMEVDAVKFPKLAEAILKKHIERTSMGTDVEYSVCSFCGNKAATPLEYCAHIPKLKGKRIYRTTASGEKEGVLVREVCYGLSFFENSLLVEEPADPTAYFLGVDDRGLTGNLARSAALIREAARETPESPGLYPDGYWDKSEGEVTRIGGGRTLTITRIRNPNSGRAGRKFYYEVTRDDGSFESAGFTPDPDAIKARFAPTRIAKAAANPYKNGYDDAKKLRKPIRVRLNQAVQTTNWSAGPMDDDGISTRVPMRGAGRPIPDGWKPVDGTIPAGTEGSVNFWWPWTATYAVEFPDNSVVQLGEDQLTFIDPMPGDKGRQPPHDPSHFQPRASISKAAALLRQAAGEFEEEKHPRGQPTNRGQFSKSPGVVAPGNPDASESVTPPSGGPGKGKAPSKSKDAPKGKGKGMGLTKEDPIQTGDVEEAAAALAEGRWVQLEHKKQASTLLDKLATLVKAAESQGEKAPPVNLCQVTVAKTNLFCIENKGIPRIRMPQLKQKASGIVPGSYASTKTPDEHGEVDLQDEFRHSLIAGGFKVTRETEKAENLKATQNELKGNQVAGMVQAMRDGTLTMQGSPIFVSNDDYIVDGHHRWAALIGLDAEDGDTSDLTMDIDRVDMDIITLLQASDEFCIANGLPGIAADTVPAPKDAPDVAKAAAFVRLALAEEMAKTAIVQPIEAPNLELMGDGKTSQARHNGCELRVTFTDNGWEAKFMGPSAYFTFDESGSIDKTKYQRKGDGAARSDFQRAWREYLAQSFVWTAIKYSTPPPWPEPDEIELVWGGRTASLADFWKSTPAPAPRVLPSWRPVMKREDAQRWAGNGQLAGPWYHGADAQGSQALLTSGFIPGKSSKANKYGPGIYLTKDKIEARKYGSGVIEVWVKPRRVGFTANYATANPEALVREDLRLPPINDFNKAIMESGYTAISIGSEWLEVLNPNDLVVVSEAQDRSMSMANLYIAQAFDEPMSRTAAMRWVQSDWDKAQWHAGEWPYTCSIFGNKDHRGNLVDYTFTASVAAGEPGGMDYNMLVHGKDPSIATAKAACVKAISEHKLKVRRTGSLSWSQGKWEIQAGPGKEDSLFPFIAEVYRDGRLFRTIAGTGIRQFESEEEALQAGKDWVKYNRSKMAAGEQIAPADVDTLRDELCPVCGESDTYDGDRCQVCNFVRPPDEFMDPDLDEAKANDLRQEDDDTAVVEDKSLACDNCGSNFKGNPADGQEPEPGDEEKATAPVVPDKTPVEVVDEQKKPADDKSVLRDRNTLPKPKKQDQQEQDPAKPKDELPGPPQQDAEVDAEEPETAPKAGDTCPDCGKGKLQEAAPKPMDGPDDEEPVDEDDEDEDDAAASDSDENPFAKKKKDDKGDKPDDKKKKPPFPPKKKGTTQKEQSMRPTLAALMEQQKIIENQDKRLAALEGGLTFVATLAGVENHPKLAALRLTADDENPAQPLADPASEPPTETTQEALAPAAKDDVATPGPTPLTNVAPGATTDVTTPVDSSPATMDSSKPADSTPPAPDLKPLSRRKHGDAAVLTEPLDLNEVDVTAPVAGTEEVRPLNEVKIETEQRMGDPSDEVAFPLEGGPFAERATTGSRESRTIAGLRLARLRMQAGIAEVGDDLSLGSQIAASDMSAEAMQTEINTLAAVMAARPKQVTARRNLVPREASVSPSFQEPVIPMQSVVASLDDGEFLFE